MACLGNLTRWAFSEMLLMYLGLRTCSFYKEKVEFTLASYVAGIAWFELP